MSKLFAFVVFLAAAGFLVYQYRKPPEPAPLQAETDDDGDHASTGWETFLEGMVGACWTVTATWPVRTEGSGRMRNHDSNALASSIVLACRPRPEIGRASCRER